MVLLKWSTWPIVPDEQRPKELPFSCEMSEGDRKLLEERGWKPLDVRLLPNEGDGERASSVKYWLEGMRLGTVDCSASVAKYVEIEARIYGLTSGRGPEEEVKKKGYEDLDFDELLVIGGVTGHATDEKQLTSPPNPAGRPPGIPRKKKSK